MNPLFLEQTSPNSCSLTSSLPQHPELLYVLKQHQLSWNPHSRKYQVPLDRVSSLLKATSTLKPRVVVREPPLKEISQLILCSRSPSKERTRQLERTERQLVLDSELRRRSYLYGQCSKMTEGGRRFTRCLFVGSKHMVCLWEAYFLGKPNIAFRNIDYKSLHPETVWKIKDDSLKGMQMEFIAYESLGGVSHLLTRAVLSKYDCLVCDDSEMWIHPKDDLNLPSDLQSTIRRVIDHFGQQKSIFLLLGSLCLDIETVLMVASLLRPRAFYTDPFLAAKGHQNNVLWMKARYKAQRFQRQLYFVLSRTIMVDLGSKDELPGPDLTEHIYRVSMGEDQKMRIQTVDGRHKSIDRKGVLSSLQTPRSTGTLLADDNAKLSEGTYVRELRSVVQEEKEGAVFQWLKHWAAFLQRRVAFVVENAAGQGRVEEYLKREEISYQVYEIRPPLLQQPSAQTSPAPAYDAMVCLLVREKVLREVRAYQHQRRLALGSEEEHSYFNQLHREDTPFSQPEFPRLSVYKHVAMFDAFWYNFDPDKELALMRALEDLSERPHGQLQPEMASNHSVDKVKHFFIFNQGCEEKILKRYLLSGEEYQQGIRARAPKIRDMTAFWDSVIDEHRDLYHSRQIITGVYDIDEEFDKLEFEARKGAQPTKKEEGPSPYNTSIKGLVVQASLPWKEKNREVNQGGQIELRSQEEHRLSNISWLQEQSSNTSSNPDSFQKKVAPYLLTPEPMKWQSPQAPEEGEERLDKRSERKKQVTVERPVLPFVQMGKAAIIHSKGAAPFRVRTDRIGHCWRGSPTSKQDRLIRKKMVLRIVLMRRQSAVSFPLNRAFQCD